MNYIKGFDALRALSIGFVMLNHLGIDGFLEKNSFARTRLWQLFSGETGVHIFFVLSGFLITSILLREKYQTGKINLKNFFARRFLRLLPPLVLFFAAIIILMSTGIVKFDLQALAMSFFYLYNYVPLLHYVNELAHTWSLAVEEQFYLIWPFCLILIRKYKTLLFFCGLCILISAVALFTFPEYAFRAHLRPKRWFIPAAGHIFVGCLFAVINTHFQSVVNRCLTKSFMCFGLALALFLAPVYIPKSFIETSSLIQSVGVGLLLLWIYHNQSHWFTIFLDFKLFVYFGKISYGLYVFQGLFLTTGYGSPFGFQQYPLNVVLTFATAILSYHCVEKPVLKLKSRFQTESV